MSILRGACIVDRTRRSRNDLFPHESPIGKVIRLSGHTYTIVGVLAEKGTAFGQSQDDICDHADHAVLRRLRRSQTDHQHRDPILLARWTYNRTFDQGVGAMRIARGLKAESAERFRDLHQRLAQERVHFRRRRRPHRRVCH